MDLETLTKTAREKTKEDKVPRCVCEKQGEIKEFPKMIPKCTAKEICPICENPHDVCNFVIIEPSK